MNALNAIIARINGVFDDPDLIAFGPLGDTLGDVLAIAEKGAGSSAYVLRLTPPEGDTWDADHVEGMQWDSSFSGLAALVEDDGDDDAVTAVTIHGLNHLDAVKRAADRYGVEGGKAEAFALYPVSLDA